MVMGHLGGYLPVTAFIQPAGLPITTSRIEVLRRPVESVQYTSIRFGEALLLEGLAASVGSVGDAYDNALAESTIGLYKNECVRKGSPFMTGPLKQLGPPARRRPKTRYGSFRWGCRPVNMLCESVEGEATDG
jgi:transposase InsO family protein